MINLCKAWDPSTDQKLNRLEKLIKQKHPNDKVLIFTQYSDTAKYINYELKKRRHRPHRLRYRR